jgi:tRNA 2-thiouridine synthesizing protein A
MLAGAMNLNETVLDLRGLRCPQPVLRAKKALRAIPIGGTLILECTDPLTMIDVPHFCNQTGHVLSDQEKKRQGLHLQDREAALTNEHATDLSRLQRDHAGRA